MPSADQDKINWTALWRDYLAKRSENTAHDPLWRIAAYWIVIFTFFSMPLVVWLGDIPSRWRGESFTYLWTFHHILAGLLAGMLGLNSVDKYTLRNSKNGKENSAQNAPKK
jgi:hypothetical protein